MTWQGKRRTDLPPNWSTIRAYVLQRDPYCQLRYDGCHVLSTEVDHMLDSTDHRPASLRGVCTPCHKQRTQQQARAGLGSKANRLAEPHPGRIGT